MGGDSSHQVGLLVLPLDMAAGVHGKLQQRTHRLSLHMLLLHPVRHRMPAKPVLSAKEQRLHLAVGKVLQWPRPPHSWPVGYIGSTLVPLGGCTWVVSRIDTSSGLRFAYPVVHANAEDTI